MDAFVAISYNHDESKCTFKGAFTCGMVKAQYIHGLEWALKNNPECMAHFFLGSYNQHETLNLVKLTSDPTEIAVLMNFFGLSVGDFDKRYVVGKDLFEVVLDFVKSLESTR